VLIALAAPVASGAEPPSLPDVPARTLDAADDLRRDLGAQAIVDLDPESGTPSMVADTSQLLTGPSNRPPEEVVKSFLLEQRELFGLGPEEVGDLKLARRYESRGRVVHLDFAQTYRGVEAVEAAVRANVTTDGELINVTGPTDPELEVPSVTPQVDRATAIYTATEAVDAVEPRRGGPLEMPNGEQAQLVIDDSGAGEPRLAWRTPQLGSDGRSFDVRVDASSGRILERRDLSVDASNALVFENHPGAAIGGTAQTVDLAPWVTNPGGPILIGPNAYAFSELNDNGQSDAGEEVPPSSGDDYEYPYVPFDLGTDYPCPPGPFFCSWDPLTPFSWEDNQHRAAVQLFRDANVFHDHLAASPIEFTPDKGAFEGDRRLFLSANHGADTDDGLPDLEEYINNAFFTDLGPDGGMISALLFGPDPSPQQEDQVGVNSVDERTVMYHEYTHGLGFALSRDASGFNSFVGHQAGSLSEAWSDWFSLDYLAGEGLMPDTPASGEVAFDQLTPSGREQPIDCAVGASASVCPASALGTAGSGGFTFGDFGKVIDRPETHADGEIWSQTLWDIRRDLIAEYGLAEGIFRARLYVTAGMELGPLDPSFLDARIAVILADLVYTGGEDNELLWNAFAERGMGWFASVIDPSTVDPVEDFSLPPSGQPGFISGKVTSKSGAPISGAPVYVGGYPDDFVDVADSQGRYLIEDVPPGTYPQVIVAPRLGFDGRVATDVPVPPDGAVRRDFKLTRDWAAIDGGAAIVDNEGPTGPGCPPAGAIDQSFEVGWETTSPATDPSPHSFTVRLPRRINVSKLMIDPSAASCRRGHTASLGDFEIWVSKSGTSFKRAASGTFTREDDWRRNPVTLSKSRRQGVRYLRLEALSTQNGAQYNQGHKHLAITEFQVYGKPP
jgi:hypothetical protein